MLPLAKKKFANILISANAITPYPKNTRALDVISTSFILNEPYPNNPLIISFDAMIKPQLAGTENNSDSSIDLF